MKVEGFSQDKSYGSVKLDYQKKRKESATLDMQYRRKTSYLVRGQVEDEIALAHLIEVVAKDKNSIAVFADPLITTLSDSCNPPIGNHNEVGRLLRYLSLHQERLDGNGVYVCIVDTGLNLDYLRERGIEPAFDLKLSSMSKLRSELQPGSVPITNNRYPGLYHRTMCAFNVCLAAPKCTLIDSAVIHGCPEDPIEAISLVSDVIKVYGNLTNWIESFRSGGLPTPQLVINNSWGLGSWRNLPHIIPIDNIEHPFNLQIQTLEEYGVDILFAAGNEGEKNETEETSRMIYGSNSHPQALCIGGVRTDTGILLSYSSQGPGSLADQKPDLCTYAHFLGSEAINSQTADDGTSTACAVASGIVAAIRTLCPPSILSPAQLRQILCNTARHPNSTDSGYFNHSYGYGLINVEGILEALRDKGFLPQS
jgi:hypothetical protein